MNAQRHFKDQHDAITSWRHHLHKTPELALETHETANFVAEKLRAFGCDEVASGIGKTGVVGLIHGRHGPGKVIGLRADMDALPIHEETGVAHQSQIDGAMHACGHDGHTAMLLGAAEYLCLSRHFDGTVAVIFQPGEEGHGGAEAMCNDGMIERFDISEVYGMHNWPGHPFGEFSIREGAFFASVDEFQITIKGKGGHAAMPQQSIDPVLVAGHLLTSLQSIVSRSAAPTDDLVVTVTSLTTGSNALNVIPETAALAGTVRSLSEEAREMAEKRMRGLAHGIASGFGAVAEIVYERKSPVLVNHVKETQFASQAAKDIGPVKTPPLVLGGEDFAVMLQHRPGAYIQLGSGDGPGLHNPKYDFNDEIIPLGCRWWVNIAEARLPLSNQ